MADIEERVGRPSNDARYAQPVRADFRVMVQALRRSWDKIELVKFCWEHAPSTDAKIPLCYELRARAEKAELRKEQTDNERLRASLFLCERDSAILAERVILVEASARKMQAEVERLRVAVARLPEGLHEEHMVP